MSKLNSLKFIYLVVATLALTTSCSKDRNLDSGRRYPILFGSTDTRAVATLQDLEDNGFKVYAYFKGNLNAASFSENVIYSAGNNVWGFDGVSHYWIPSTKYWFTAFYPSESSAGTVTVTNNAEAFQSYKIEKFDINAQEDIMVAKAAREVVANAEAPTEGSVVNLDFEHLLACVVVEIKCELTGATIKSVILTEIADNATCENGVWTSTNTTSITHTPTDVTLDSTNFVDVTGGGILVVPESVNGRQTITINASHKNYDPVVIPATTWEKGMKYTYRATIKQNDIIFDNAPSVAVWDSDSATGSVIIK